MSSMLFSLFYDAPYLNTFIVTSPFNFHPVERALCHCLFCDAPYLNTFRVTTSPINFSSCGTSSLYVILFLWRALLKHIQSDELYLEGRYFTCYCQRSTLYFLFSRCLPYPLLSLGTQSSRIASIRPLKSFFARRTSALHQVLPTVFFADLLRLCQSTAASFDGLANLRLRRGRRRRPIGARVR